jgi:hypothetical protein
VEASLRSLPDAREARSEEHRLASVIVGLEKKVQLKEADLKRTVESLAAIDGQIADFEQVLALQRPRRCI